MMILIGLLLIGISILAELLSGFIKKPAILIFTGSRNILAIKVNFLLSYDNDVKKTIFISVKLLVSTVLIIVMFNDMQWPQILKAFKCLPLWGLGTMLGLYLLAQILGCLRWRMICQSLQLPSDCFYLLKLYFLGMFCNLFLPTGVGGDAIKSYALGKSGNSQLNAAHSVLFDRISGMVAMLLLALIALMMIRPEQRWISGLIITIAVLGLGSLLAVPKIIALLVGHLPKFTEYLTPVLVIYQDHGRFALLFVLALMVQVLGFIIVIGLGNMLGIQVEPAFYIVSWAAITLMTLLPISINGIGVREAGFVYLFQLQGVPAELAMTLGVLTFAIPACASLFGVIPLLQDGLKAQKIYFPS